MTLDELISYVETKELKCGKIPHNKEIVHHLKRLKRYDDNARHYKDLESSYEILKQDCEFHYKLIKIYDMALHDACLNLSIAATARGMAKAVQVVNLKRKFLHTAAIRNKQN